MTSKRAPKSKIKPLHVVGLEDASLEGLNAIYNSLLNEAVKARKNAQSNPSWRDVAILLDERTSLVHLIMRLRTLLESPFIASAVTVQKKLKELEDELMYTRYEGSVE